MRALIIMLSLMLAGLMGFRAVLFSVDFSRFQDQIAEAGPNTVPGLEDLSAKSLAESVAGFAKVFGFTLSADTVGVIKKAEYERPSELKGLPPEKFHDYVVTATVSRWVLPLWTRTETVAKTTTARCNTDHKGNGEEVYNVGKRNP